MLRDGTTDFGIDPERFAAIRGASRGPSAFSGPQAMSTAQDDNYQIDPELLATIRNAGRASPRASEFAVPQAITTAQDSSYQINPLSAGPASTASPLAVSAPNFGMYSGSAKDYKQPELSPANEQYKSPYYSAYTNDGDFAGAVMAAPGQRLRLVDVKSGQVVFEGTGPEAAQQAVGIANAVSDDKGRKAAWQIQADYGGSEGWKTQAAERYDPKKRGVWGTVLDIAAPFILNAILPGLGGALGGMLGSQLLGRAAFAGIANLGSGLIQGESLKEAAGGALTAGATAGLTQGVLSKFPGVENALSKVTDPVQNVFNTALGPVRAVLDPVNSGLVHLIDSTGNIVSSVKGGIDDVRSAIQGIGQGPSVTGVSPPGYVNFVNTPGDIGTGLDPFTVAGIDVTAPSNFAVTPGLPTPGLPLSPGEVELEGVTATGQRPAEQPGVPTTGIELQPVQLEELKPGTPTVTVQPPSTLPGVPTPVPDTGGYGPGIAGAGTPSSLTGIFTKPLPVATFGKRTPRDVDIDTRYAIDRPEASFFMEIPERLPLAKGGRTSFRVDGMGDGRSDDVDAALSDGEYVVDAETVALLGNGSSKAGADALDRFRVNIRKHKGRDLAKGRFSVKAREPHRYLEAR